jgi:hypothetical protein
MEAYALRASIPKWRSLRAFSSEKGALHTRLEAYVCFDI